ncbi:MAG TPA: PadR family transcriptional regulator [Rhodothermales bacterium]|nr:PadR family transcriptional regulator [Rhodothermales bacterium]
MLSKSMTAASINAIILSLLEQGGESYGYLIIKNVRELSGGAIDWPAGSLYPVLHRLKTEGLVESYWNQPEGERRRRYYRITAKGRQALSAEKSQWFTVHNLLIQLWGPQPSLT